MRREVGLVVYKFLDSESGVSDVLILETGCFNYHISLVNSLELHFSSVFKFGVNNLNNLFLLLYQSMELNH